MTQYFIPLVVKNLIICFFNYHILYKGEEDCNEVCTYVGSPRQYH